MGMNHTIWTSELVARLHELYVQNLPVSDIATIMGLSKGTVIGKIHRTGMKNSRSRRNSFSTTADRLDALKDRMDAVLAVPVIRLPPRQDEPRALTWRLG